MGPDDNQKFRSEVAEEVSVEMPLITAKEHLAKAGFSCDERSSSPEVTCTRDKESVLPYSCVQRVNLTPDSKRETVIAVTPKAIICAGF